MEDQESKLIHAFIRNEHEKIHLSVRKYRGKHYADLRLWYQTPEDPTYKPTRKGLTIPLELIPELQQGIQRLLKVRHKITQTEEILSE